MTLTQPEQGLLFVIGSPGAGKGTLCARLATRWGWAHVSVGDELRAYSRACDDHNDIVVKCVRNAELIPVEQLVRILNRRVQDLREQGYTSFIIDGFPRHVDQISRVHDELGVPDRVLYMDCPKEVAKARVMARSVCGRIDDEVVFEKRFAEFCANDQDIRTTYSDMNRMRRADTSHTEDISLANVLLALADYVVPGQQLTQD